LFCFTPPYYFLNLNMAKSDDGFGLTSLFKTRGSGVKYSKKRQYTKRKYEKSKKYTKEAKAMWKADQEAKKLARIERFNAKMNAKLLAPPKRRGRPKGSKNRMKRSGSDNNLLQLGGAVAPPARSKYTKRQKAVIDNKFAALGGEW
jgi:hypothetical protein